MFDKTTDAVTSCGCCSSVRLVPDILYCFHSTKQFILSIYLYTQSNSKLRIYRLDIVRKKKVFFSKPFDLKCLTPAESLKTFKFYSITI